MCDGTLCPCGILQPGDPDYVAPPPTWWQRRQLRNTPTGDLEGFIERYYTPSLISPEFPPGWFGRWRQRRRCMHGAPANWGTPGVDGTSYVVALGLIDFGRQKLFTCDESVGGCGKLFFS